MGSIEEATIQAPKFETYYQPKNNDKTNRGDMNHIDNNNNNDEENDGQSITYQTVRTLN